MQICLVTANQAQAEEQTDWDDSSEVYAARHGHLLSRVEYGGKAGETLGHNGGKDQMPCCEGDGKVCGGR
jgi:hypothetical protein